MERRRPGTRDPRSAAAGRCAASELFGLAANLMSVEESAQKKSRRALGQLFIDKPDVDEKWPTSIGGKVHSLEGGRRTRRFTERMEIESFDEKHRRTLRSRAETRRSTEAIQREESVEHVEQALLPPAWTRRRRQARVQRHHHARRAGGLGDRRTDGDWTADDRAIDDHEGARARLRARARGGDRRSSAQRNEHNAAKHARNPRRKIRMARQINNSASELKTAAGALLSSSPPPALSREEGRRQADRGRQDAAARRPAQAAWRRGRAEEAHHADASRPRKSRPRIPPARRASIQVEVRKKRGAWVRRDEEAAGGPPRNAAAAVAPEVVAEARRGSRTDADRDALVQAGSEGQDNRNQPSPEEIAAREEEARKGQAPAEAPVGRDQGTAARTATKKERDAEEARKVAAEAETAARSPQGRRPTRPSAKPRGREEGDRRHAASPAAKPRKARPDDQKRPARYSRKKPPLAAR